MDEDRNISFGGGGVATTYAGKHYLYPGIASMQFEFFIAAANIVLVILEPGILEMGSDYHLVVPHSLEGFETFNTLFHAFGAIVDPRYEMAVHVGSKGLENGAGFLFFLEEIKHGKSVIVYSTLRISAPKRRRRSSKCW